MVVSESAKEKSKLLEVRRKLQGSKGEVSNEKK